MKLDRYMTSKERMFFIMAAIAYTTPINWDNYQIFQVFYRFMSEVSREQNNRLNTLEYQANWMFTHDNVIVSFGVPKYK